MIEVGDLNQFGFRIGPVGPEPEIREVSIFIHGTDVTPFDNSAYLPTFISHLEADSKYLKQKIDYLKHDKLFHGLNLSEIHNLLLHGSPKIFRDEREWSTVDEAHRFAQWGETTDGFVAFLVPYFDRLYLTYQIWPESRSELLDVIDSTETTPHYLIRTLDEAIAILRT